MRLELEQRLVQEFPDLFVDRTLEPQFSNMCFGCECDNGWYEILHSLCALIHQYLTSCRENNEHPYRFSQIKEKYGGLRVYGYGGDDYIQGVIDMAEAMAYRTCEMCGNPGVLCHAGIWLKTLCNQHAKEGDYVPVKKDDDI